MRGNLKEGLCRRRLWRVSSERTGPLIENVSLHVYLFAEPYFSANPAPGYPFGGPEHPLGPPDVSGRDQYQEQPKGRARVCERVSRARLDLDGGGG